MSDRSRIQKLKSNSNNVIVKRDNTYSNGEYYYPKESYLEDFEIEHIETMQILEYFKPLNTDS